MYQEKVHSFQVMYDNIPKRFVGTKYAYFEGVPTDFCVRSFPRQLPARFLFDALKKFYENMLAWTRKRRVRYDPISLNTSYLANYSIDRRFPRKMIQ